MKTKIGQILLSLILLLHFSMQASAINTGFSTEEYPKEKQDVLVSNTDFAFIETDPGKKSIQCFDVNNKGKIAIGQEMAGNRKGVCIYSSDGSFLYGYSFECSGSFYVEWDNENLNIMFVRGDVLISVSPDGDILDIKNVLSTAGNREYSLYLSSKKRTVGDAIYMVRNNMGPFNYIAASYSQLLVINADGNEKIVYDVNIDQLTKTIVVFILVLIFITIVVIGLVRTFVKLKRNSKNES